MKKFTRAILLFDLLAGLLLLGLYSTGAAARTEERPAEELPAEILTVSTLYTAEPQTAARPVPSPAPDEAAQCPKIAITFDDGPHPQYTEQLLDGLKERGVHATFFVTGEHASLHPDIIRRMYEEGHLIGNHTYSHMQLRNNNREQFKEELIKTNEIITEITGEDVVYVRPPYGSWDKKFETELNMFPVLWTIDPLDWCSHNADCITSKILARAGENDIILMHDYYDTTVVAALQVIDDLMEKGYVFVTVEEILFD